MFWIYTLNTLSPSGLSEDFDIKPFLVIAPFLNLLLIIGKVNTFLCHMICTTCQVFFFLCWPNLGGYLFLFKVDFTLHWYYA